MYMTNIVILLLLLPYSLSLSFYIDIICQVRYMYILLIIDRYLMLLLFR